MRCAWTELIELLPPWLREEVNRIGKTELQELRLRINAPPQLVMGKGETWLSHNVQKQDLTHILNMASRYSPWRTSTISQGYLTAPGGHRIGICGEAVCQDGICTGIREVQSLCIRVARDLDGLLNSSIRMNGSVLILGAPSWGKTTLLRAVIRKFSETETVCVVDERGELFPEGFSRGRKLDVLSGCSKAHGIDTLLKTMGPVCIAVDEITSREDCHALIQAAHCGVRLLATAHASSVQDFFSRPVYQPLVQEQILDTLLILRKDKTFTLERMESGCTNGSAHFSF